MDIQTNSDFEPALIIRSSAGSGKTFDLATRYIQLLLSGHLPEQILATTFTRKAAAEISERIIQLLASWSINPESCQNVLGYQPPKEHIEGALRRFLRSRQSAQILTFDSFFLKITDLLAFDFGLPLSVTILDNAESERSRKETLEEIFSSFKEEKLYQLIQMLSPNNISTRAFSRAEKGIIEMLEQFLRASKDSFKAGEGLLRQLLSVPSKIDFNKLSTLQAPTSKEGKPLKRWSDTFTKDYDLLLQNKHAAFLKGGIAAKLLQNEVSYCGREIPLNIRDLYLELIDYAAAKLLNDLIQRNASLDFFLAEYAKRRIETKKQSPKFTFSELKDFLAARAITDRLSVLYFNLDSKINHLLFDEFQDTSLAEWRLLEPLVSEVLAKADHQKSFFCVGDAKQAIYGWRGGVAQIFDHLEKVYPQIKVISKNVTYRCAPQILNLLNITFTNLENCAQLANYEKTLRFWRDNFSTHVSHATQIDGYVELNLFYPLKPDKEKHDQSEETENQEDLGIEEADQYLEAAKKVRSLIFAGFTGTIAILTRKNDGIEKACQALDEVSLGGLYSDESRGGLARSQVIDLILRGLSLGFVPEDNETLFMLEISPLKEWFGESGVSSKKMRIEIAKHGYASVAAKLALILAKNLTENEKLRVEKFVSLAARSESLGESLSEFVDKIRGFRGDLGGNAQIRVMTIHQSKGLEFDCVFLLELDELLIKETLAPLELRDDALAPAKLIIPYPIKPLRARYPALEALWKHNKENDLLGGLCLLYVAITRAKKMLFCYLGEKNSTPKLSTADIILATLEVFKKSNNQDLSGWQKVFSLGAYNINTAKPAKLESVALNFEKSLNVQNNNNHSSTPTRRSHRKPIFNTSLTDLINANENNNLELQRFFSAFCRSQEWFGEELTSVGALRDSLKTYSEKIKCQNFSDDILLKIAEQVFAAKQTTLFLSQETKEKKLKRSLSIIGINQKSLVEIYFERVIIQDQIEGFGLLSYNLFIDYSPPPNLEEFEEIAAEFFETTKFKIFAGLK
ncbi:MAG TPA: UvrD-helicase domain-containing protein [Oligoflexia bacterium]|nr:UvrD-helicase domain-containing protein [Oligoflexia bacterium]HMP26448.1 UvrD-helicase domain-containing protein [Oligoflexia bacterium]